MKELRFRQFRNLHEVPKDIDKFVDCNFTQPQPDMSGAQPVGWPLFPDGGRTLPTIFERCALVNVEPTPQCEVIGGATWVKEHNVLDYEDVVIVDGVEVARTPHYKTIVYGKWENATKEYSYLPVPLEYPEV